MKIREIAHSRTGDKGNISTISVIAYRTEDYETICEKVTEVVVMETFKKLGATKVQRYEVESLGALNFVIHGCLDGGVTKSLALDRHGKSLSNLMLDIEI